ncbi:hypothetical protein ACROYT_G032625 [Oculina patagonica]
MQGSSRIPRRISAEHDRVLSNAEVKTDKQEAARKISLTDQGKAAKLLRQRLAFSLATNTKLKSDSSNSESDPETIGKALKGERKTSIPRKISQETAKKLPQGQHLLEVVNIPKAGERSRKFGASQPFLSNGVGNVKQENNSKANLPSQKKTTPISSFSSGINNEIITNDNTDVTLSQVPPSRDESLPTIHEKATTKAERDLSPSHYNLDVVESELVKLKVEVNKTLVDFQEINEATEHVKKKLEELRRVRIRSAS